MILRTIGRLILVPVAFVLAVAAALFVLVTLGQERVVHGMSRRAPDEATVGAAFDLARIAWSLLSVNTLLAPLAVVIVGEVARIRSVAYYVLGGGAALLAVPLLARLGDDSLLSSSAAVWQVFATAGFTGGLVYWLLAGRRA